MDSKNITRTQLSRRAEINYATINVIYNNPDHDVSIKLLERIAIVLGCNISDLYTIINDDQERS